MLDKLNDAYDPNVPYGHQEACVYAFFDKGVWWEKNHSVHDVFIDDEIFIELVDIILTEYPNEITPEVTEMLKFWKTQYPKGIDVYREWTPELLNPRTPETAHVNRFMTKCRKNVLT